MSQRGDALAALLTVITAALAAPASVTRATGTPEAIPSDGALVTIHEGACEAAEPLLSPLRYEIIWSAPVTVDADSLAIRDAAIEAIAAALVASPTLDGAVDWAEMGMPEAEVVSSPAMDGMGQQPPIFAVNMPVRLHYVATSPAG
jgi:hypothetical protein